MKLGIIGCGAVFEKFHLPAYLKMENIEITAVCDTREDRLEKFCKSLNIKYCFENWKELIKLNELNVVSICTPNYLHSEITIEGLKKNKHILLEKPIATKVEDAEKIIKANARSRGRLMIGFTHRFNQINKIAKKAIEKGLLGVPNMIRIRIAHSGMNIHWNPVTDWYYVKEKSGGGVLMDLGTDAVDLIRYFLGEIIEVSAYTFSLNELIEVEDSASAILKIENNIIGIIDVSWCSASKDCIIEIFGDSGTIKIDYNNYPPLKLFNKNNKMLNIPAWFSPEVTTDPGFEDEIEYFINSIKQKKGFISNANDGYSVLKVIKSIYESAEKNKPIRVNTSSKIE